MRPYVLHARFTNVMLVHVMSQNFRAACNNAGAALALHPYSWSKLHSENAVHTTEWPHDLMHLNLYDMKQSFPQPSLCAFTKLQGNILVTAGTTVVMHTLRRFRMSYL